MNHTTVSAFFDELEKIAISGAVPQEKVSLPKTPAPTPAPAARTAPTSVPKAPVSAPVGAPRGGLGAIRNPGLRAQVVSTRALTGFNPSPVNQGTIAPKKTPVPNLRSVTTMPSRQVSPPKFAPGNEGMGQYMRRPSASDLGIPQ
jgi:hypothetical protein